MANAEHLEILKSGVENWNEWREEHQNIRPDLSGADLGESDLCDAELREANLSKADLGRANLSDANLTKADLSEAYLEGANLCGANLREADLWGADLSGADLIRADLSLADLTGAKLLDGALLVDALLIKANLSGANLSRSNISRSDLTQANLSTTNLSEAYLSETNLNKAKLCRTIFGLTDLSSCKNLESVEVFGPCIIDFYTLNTSKNLPQNFLTKLGIHDSDLKCLPYSYDPVLRSYPVVISYSWADNEFVSTLYEVLTKQGITAWLDENKMALDNLNFYDNIWDAIKYYEKLILVCSKSALEDWRITRVLERAYKKEQELQKEQSDKFRLVIPIKIDDSVLGWNDGIEAKVKSSVIGDFTKWQDEAEFEKAIKELVGTLNAEQQ